MKNGINCSAPPPKIGNLKLPHGAFSNLVWMLLLIDSVIEREMIGLKIPERHEITGRV